MKDSACAAAMSGSTTMGGDAACRQITLVNPDVFTASGWAIT